MGRLGYKIIIIIIISWGKIGEGDWEGGRNKRKKDKKNINLLTFFAVLGGLWSYKAGLVPGLGLSQPDLDFKDSRYYFNFSHPLSDTHSESITSNHRFGIIHPLRLSSSICIVEGWIYGLNKMFVYCLRISQIFRPQIISDA